MLAVVDRWGQFGAPATHAPKRPVVAGVIHNTVTLAPATPQYGASWNYQITREGAIYRDVPEDGWCAHHVRDSDRWRPSWALTTPKRYQLSDVNWCAIGIELTSYAGAPNAPCDYLPYTPAQYTSLGWLLDNIETRRGPLPWVGHGELQLDRTDPVGFDWTRAGFGPLDRTYGGRHYKGEPMPILTEPQQVEIATNVWGTFPFNPAAAIAQAWLVEWRGGRDRGPPLTPERPFTGGVYQEFARGRAVYLPGSAVSWEA